MRVTLSKEAEVKILANYEWTIRHWGIRVAERTLEQIRNRIYSLSIFPYMGPAEESLPGMGRSYRYLRVRPHFKLIYFVDELRAELHVVDFWDTRRDPNQLTTKLTIND